MEKRDPLTPIDQEERVGIPVVWFVVLGLVGLGIIANILLSIFVGGGMAVWPFVFAVSVLLIINKASDEHAVGVPPLQAYAFFFGTLIGFFGFIWLVSKTINPFVVILLALSATGFLVYDWNKRREKQRELDRRRMAGLCVKCLTPVTNGLGDECPNCGTLVHAERLNLLQLGKAIQMKDRSTVAREVLTGKKAGQVHKTTQRLQTQRAARYGPRKGK